MLPETKKFIDEWCPDKKIPSYRLESYKNIYNDIRNLTKDLNKKYTLVQRVWCLKYGKTHSICPHCGKESKFYDRYPIREQYCSVSCGSTAPETNKKREQTSIEKYGISNASRTKEANEKRRKSISESWKKRQKNYLHSYMPKELKNDEWIYENHIIKNKSCTDIASELGVSISSVHRHIDHSSIERKKRNNPKSESKEEKEIFDLYKNYNPIKNYQFNNKEIDIFFKDYNFGIEHDGVYWHSYNYNPSKKHRNKHQLKKQECMNHNIHLIQIWDHEWNDTNKKEIIISMIDNKLKNHKTIIRASKCQIKQVDYKQEKEFLTKNHIQGYSQSKICYGLYYENQLVYLMSFGVPRFTKKYSWELIRCCGLIHTKIHGAASKLFKHFLQNNSGSIISYCNLRYGNGKLYNSLGFTYTHTTDPSYFYFHKKTKTIITRYQSQKHKLNKILTNFDSNKTESENMFYHGYKKCWDSGNLVYEYINN